MPGLKNIGDDFCGSCGGPLSERNTSGRCLSCAHLGQKPWNKGKIYEAIRSEKHPQWRGDQASQTAIHNWVKRRLGRPKRCEKCGTTKASMYHWSNVSGKYRRDLKDWQRLCVPCHKAFDLARLRNA